MKYRYSDLPEEHGESKLNPSQSHGIVTGTSNKNFSKKHSARFATTPPVQARTFSFSLASDTISKILPSDTKRRGFLLQNISAFDIWVSIGSQPGFDGLGGFINAILLPTGTVFESPAGWSPVSDIYAVSSSNATVVIVESTLIK